MIYVGIPQWHWKKKLLSYAKSKPNFKVIDITNLAYECERHFEILSMFDCENSNYSTSKYYQYQVMNKKNHKDIDRKINNFRSLYASIKKEGCKKSPIVTEDGCRLDGSHRSAILVHLGKKEAKVNIVLYGLVFDKEECQLIQNQVKDFRKSYYGITS